MFGDEKTLPNVEDMLAKKQQEEGSGIVDIGTGLDLSLKYMMQMYSDTLETMTGNTQVNASTTLNEDCESENEEGMEEVNAAEMETSLFHLPVQVHLHIFSYLEASDICQLGATCQHIQSLCNDELLWRDTLNREKRSWTELGNTSNPALYSDVNSDLSYKEIYLRCNPRCSRHQHFAVLPSIPRLLWFLLPQKVPKIVMFGPGLDSSTSGIVRKLIGDTTGVFKVQGVFPAEQPGSVGTGFNISVKNKTQLRLITLYSGTKRDRTNSHHLSSRADRNKLLRPAQSANNTNQDGSDDGELLKYEPTVAVRTLCGSIDAFIFVVDASVPIETLQESRPELFAMLNERWTPSKSPLLVLSCVPGTGQPNKLPCVDVAEELAMHRLNRVWKMLDADVSSLSGVVDGITWLLDATHRR